MVVAVIALVIALTGSAWAALGKNSVGTKQLKSQAVTTGKIANNAVNSTKVKNGSLTGADINLGALGTVPSATNGASANNAATVTGHPATCPGGTTLIRGICFDSASNAAVSSLKVASESCASKGGFLPTVMELYSTKSILNLGTGTGSDAQFTDAMYANTSGGQYKTLVVSGTGKIEEVSPESPFKYICSYPLVR
jgi:hypothetical protein